MEKELGPEVIKATQTSLGKYVKRPPLTEKLLKKPPFRFLHDVIISVLKSHGFFEGLFEEDELISDNVKDRDSKILFLNKVISVVALATGNNLNVKSSKIVAGQEPDKTNELLQSLAYALDKKITSDEAVKKYKEKTKAAQATEENIKEKESKQVKKNNDTKKLTSRSSEKLTSNKKESAIVNKNDKTKTSDPKSKRKEAVTSKNESQVKKSQNLKAVGKKVSVESIAQPPINNTQIEEHEKQNVSTSQINHNKEIDVIDEVKISEVLKPHEESTEISSNTEVNAFKSHQEIEVTLNNSYTIGENELNSSLSSQDLMEVENDKIDNTKPIVKPVTESKDIISENQTVGTTKEPILKTDETASVRKPGAALIPKYSSLDSEPKTKELVRNNSHDISGVYTNRTPPDIRPLSVRPSSSRPGAPRLREKIDNIIPESDHLLLGKVNIITETTQNDEEEDSSVIIVEQHDVSDVKLEDQQEVLQVSSKEHGHLVQQILNSQKELIQVAGKTEIEWQFGAQKAKEASYQEIEQLRYNIQALSRVANPLGKLLDHIQEDVEVMRQELHQWTNVYEEVSKDMIKQKAASEETLVPLKTRVKQLDMDIVEKRDKINDIKILIHKNTARIDKLLVNGHVQ